MDIPTAISEAYVPRSLSVDILAALPENVRHLLAISISHSSPSLSAGADRQLSPHRGVWKINKAIGEIKYIFQVYNYFSFSNLYYLVSYQSIIAFFLG